MAKPFHVLFLDFDGPLFPDRVINLDNRNRDGNPQLEALRATIHAEGNTFGAYLLSYWKMDECAVGSLMDLYAKVPYQIVVSSSWRELYSRESIHALLHVNGLEVPLHPDWTIGDDVLGTTRLGLISVWLSQHHAVDHYAILDDKLSLPCFEQDPDWRHLKIDPNKVIIVDVEVGLTTDSSAQLHQLFQDPQ